MARPLFTATFWLDALERALKTFAQATLGLLALVATPEVSWDWKVAIIAVVVPTLGSVLTSIVSTGIGEAGTASLLNPAPPDTLEDRGQANVVTIVVIAILAVLAVLYVLEHT